MKEKVICYIMIYGCYGLFAALNCYDFLNQYCSNLLKNPTVRGLTSVLVCNRTSTISYSMFFKAILKF